MLLLYIIQLFSCLFFIRGATCYLNSLIQALYMTPELRAGLFELSLDDLQVVTTAPPAPAASSPDNAAAEPSTDSQSNKSEEAQQQQQEKNEEPDDSCNELDQEKKPDPQNSKNAQSGERQQTTTDEGKKRKGEGEEEEETKEFLASMGFEPAQVQRAIARFRHDRARAVEWLLSGAADNDDDDDDGFGGAPAGTLMAERDAEEAETDISGFGSEFDPFGDGTL
jgi:hypothetical protein